MATNPITTTELRTIEFSFKARDARQVGVAGSFNNWDPARAPMRKQRGGLWKTALQLPPGRHEYRFVADGQWVSDPGAAETVANSFGDKNAVCVV